MRLPAIRNTILAMNIVWGFILNAQIKPGTNACAYVETKEYRQDREYACSNALFLNTDSTYLYHFGCQEYFTNSIGRYLESEGEIYLTPARLGKDNILCAWKIALTSDNNQRFFVKDKSGRPIPRLKISISKPGMDKPKIFVTDSAGMISVARDSYKILSIPALAAVTAPNADIDIDGTKEDCIIRVNLNEGAFAHGKAESAQFRKRNMVRLSAYEIIDVEFVLKLVK